MKHNIIVLLFLIILGSNQLFSQTNISNSDIYILGIIELDTPIVVNFHKFNKSLILEKSDLSTIDYENVIFKYCIFNDVLGLKMTNNKFIWEYIIPYSDSNTQMIIKNCYPDTSNKENLEEVKCLNSNFFFYGNYYYLTSKKYLKVLINLDFFINVFGYNDLFYLLGNENKKGYFVKLLIPICL